MSDKRFTDRNKASRALLMLSMLMLIVFGGLQPGLAGAKEVWTGFVDDPSFDAQVDDLTEL